MIDANPIPHGIFGASVACALFFYSHVVHTRRLIGHSWNTVDMYTFCNRHADDNTHCHVSWVSFGILHASSSYSP
jgi:hypothetical protein